MAPRPKRLRKHGERLCLVSSDRGTQCRREAGSSAYHVAPASSFGWDVTRRFQMYFWGLRGWEKTSADAVQVARSVRSVPIGTEPHAAVCEPRYCRSTVKRLIEYPSAPPMKTSDRK